MLVLGCWVSCLGKGVAQVGDSSSLQTGAVQEMRSKGGRERQWSNSRVL